MRSTPTEFRDTVARMRRALGPEASVAHSRAVSACFEESARALRHLSSARIALYRSVRGEVDTTAFRDWIALAGYTPVYPRVTGQTLEWRQDPDACGGSWSRGSFGIPEPDARCPVVQPQSLDVILVPGLAFGMSGERLGWGRGYYDRALPSSSRALRIAFAYEFQVFESLPQEPWDQRVDWIFTEKRDIPSTRSRDWLQSRGLVTA